LLTIRPQYAASVLDFASGSGLVAVAAAKAGAGEVIAADIDPFCDTAIRLNAAVSVSDSSAPTAGHRCRLGRGSGRRRLRQILR
jgi:predicted nicotinamide N-methyase